MTTPVRGHPSPELGSGAARFAGVFIRAPAFSLKALIARTVTVGAMRPPATSSQPVAMGGVSWNSRR